MRLRLSEDAGRPHRPVLAAGVQGAGAMPGDRGDPGAHEESTGGLREAGQHRERPTAGQQPRAGASAARARGKSGNRAEQTIGGT